MVRRSAALACLLASGCLLTTDLDGLTGPVDAAPLDAGTDAYTDATDASDPTDATEDVQADAPTDARPKLCPHLFCADFDESADVTHGWSNTEITGGGVVALETSLFTSAPHAFASSLPPNAAFQAALLANYSALTPSEMHLDTRVYFDQLDVSQFAVSFVVLGVSNGTKANSQARITVATGLATLTEEYTDGDGGPHAHSSSGAYNWPLHKWLDVRVDVTPTTASLTIDGVTYASLGKLGSWDQPQATLKLGLYYSAGQSGQRILFDDVTVAVK